VFDDADLERLATLDYRRFSASWTDGDFNGDRSFQPDDLMLAFQEGGYGRGPRVDVNSGDVASAVD
jgi:hypothetical protein